MKQLINNRAAVKHGGTTRPPNSTSKSLRGLEQASGNHSENQLFWTDPRTLIEHPQLVSFPELPLDQYARLKTSIAERGVLQPLLINSKRQIVDGKHRARGATELGITKVPVLVDDSVEAIRAAIETAASRRQLTRSALALLIWEQLPELREDRQGVKKRFLLRGKKGGTLLLPGSEQEKAYMFPSYRKAAEHFGLVRNHLTTLSKLWDNLEEDEWIKVRASILAGDYNLDRAPAAFAGKVQTEGKNRKDPIPFDLLTQGVKQLTQRLARWEKLNASEKHKLLTYCHEQITDWPEDFRNAIAEFFGVESRS